MSRPVVVQHHGHLTLTLNLQGQILRMLYLRNVESHNMDQHSIDSHPLCSMSIDLPILEIQLFQNLTLNIQGQGHGWGECWTSQHVQCPTFYRLTSLSIHVNRPSHSWDATFSKFDLENPRSRSCWKSQSGCNILSIHIPFDPCQSALQFNAQLQV